MSRPIFRGRARGSVQCRAELRRCVGGSCAREARLREPELLCVEPDDLECLVSESGEGSRGTAELRCEPLVSHGGESPTRLEHRDEPACRLQPERRRHRLLEEVRAAIGVERWARASAAHPSASRSSSASTSATARRETSIAAVSTMSWLVAPRWTYSGRLVAGCGRGARGRAAPPGSRPRGRRLRGAPGRRARRGTPLRSERRRPSGRGRPRRLPSRGRVPRRASPAATPDPRPRRAAPSGRRWPRTASHREECRLARALEDDVEAKRAVLSRATRVGRSAGSSPRSTGSSAFAVSSSGKYIRVATRFKRPRAKTPTRRCGAWSRPSTHGTRPGFTVDEREAAVALGARPPEAGESGLERNLLAIVRGMRVATRCVRLPDLDHAVRDRISGAVEKDARNANRARVGLVDEMARDRAAEEPDLQVRPGGLRRGERDLSRHAAPRAASPRGRRERCRSGIRVPSPAASGPARTSRPAAVARARHGWN